MRQVFGRLRWLFFGTGSLRAQTMRGGFWLVAADVLAQGAGMLKLAVIGRVLAPADFGLLGVALVVQRMVESFTDTGVMSALIQKRGDVRPYLDTAWTVQVLRGIFVSAVVFVAAPFGGKFFGSPESVPAIRCIGFTTLLWGLTNPAVIYLRRDLRFGADVAWRSCGVLVSLVVAIPAAFWLRNAWSLIVALIAGRIGDLVASYWINPFRPKLRLQWRETRELMKFGRWISVWNMAGFLENQTDSVAIGRFLGTMELGFYQVAMQFATPFVRLGTHIQGVLFPAISKLDTDEARRRAFLASLGILSSTLIPVALVISAFAAPIIRIAVGPKWSAAAPILQVLLWAVVARSISACTAPLLMGIGCPRKLVETQGIKLLILSLLLYPGTYRYGTLGIAWVVALSSTVAAVLQCGFSASAVGAGIKDLLLRLRPAAFASLPALLRALAPGAPPEVWGTLLVGSLVGYVWFLKDVAGPLLARTRLHWRVRPSAILRLSIIGNDLGRTTP